MGALAVNPLPEAAYDQARESFEHIVGYLDSAEANTMTHSELERELEKRGRELMRQMLQEHLDRRGPGRCQEPVCGADGIERRCQRLQERNLETVLGTVSVERTGYGQPGMESLHPLDAELNLPDERYSLELRRRVAREAAKVSFDQSLESIIANTGAHPGKRQLEELVMRAAHDFDAFYEQKQAIAASGDNSAGLLVISVDGKGIVMRTEDLRQQTRRAAEARRRKMGKRLSKGEKKHAKRMATVATVYSIAAHVRSAEAVMQGASKGPRPENKRVWASVEKDPEAVIAQAFAEARQRDPAGVKQWVALVDGAPEQLRLLRRIARKEGVALTIVMDVIHVIEYLWKAGRVFHPASGADLEGWVQHRVNNILQGKAGLMAGGMRRSATRHKLSPEDRKPVDICARYLLNHSHYLRYDRYLARGLPIATGVIEGACRHLIKDRMDVTGARWSLAGAEAVLRLRALRSSGDFDQYWRFHEMCEYRRTHQSRYADGIVPRTEQSTSEYRAPHLRVIK